MNITGNINNSGQVLQTWLYRQVLKNFEPQLRFYDMGTKPIYQEGYQTLAWTRVNRLEVTPASALLNQGVTPVETNINLDTITLVPKQYGMYVTLSDYLLDVAPINLVKEASKQVGNNMARIIDSVIQSNLATNGTYVNYGGTAVIRTGLTSGDTATAKDFAKANAFLMTKGAPMFSNGYIGVVHPNVVYDLQMESGVGAFVDVNKYSKPDQVMSGEIGKMFGIRLVTSGYIQTFASNVTVYPTYILWEGAYGVATLQTLQAYITPRMATDSDPLAQRVKVGSKVAFDSIILQQKALVRLETASSLSYAW